MNSLKVLLIYLFSILLAFKAYTQIPTPPVPPAPEEEEIFRVVEEMPRFPGCEDKEGSSKDKEDCAKGLMLDYIYGTLNYPAVAKEEFVEGMAVIQFTIWKDGSVRNIKIVRNPGVGTGEEAARIVETMNSLENNWRPGHQKGRPVCVQYTLPVKFKLDDESRKPKSVNESSDIFSLSKVDEEPIFPGCKKYKNYNCTSESLQEFIKENQLYPEKALENKTEGIVKIEFIIEEDGSLSNIKSLNKLADGLSEDAIELFEWMNTEGMLWRPGMKKYKSVRTRYMVDVAYDLAGWQSRN